MLLLEVGYCTPAAKAKGGWKRERERVFPILNRINAGEGHWEKDVASTRSLPLIQFRQRLFVHLYLCVWACVCVRPLKAAAASATLAYVAHYALRRRVQAWLI